MGVGGPNLFFGFGAFLMSPSHPEHFEYAQVRAQNLIYDAPSGTMQTFMSSITPQAFPTTVPAVRCLAPGSLSGKTAVPHWRRLGGV